MKSPKGSTLADSPVVEQLIRSAEGAARSGNDGKARDCLEAIFETLSAYQMNRRPVNADAASSKSPGYRIAHSA